MKKTFGFLLICATLALLSLPVLASKVSSGATETLQDPCTIEGKIALYALFLKELTADQAKAYEAAKKYVACPAETTEQTQEVKDAEAKRIAYMNNFIAKFEKARRKDQFNEAVAKKDYAKAFELGKQYLVDDPNNIKTFMDMALSGTIAELAPNDTLAYAQKALQMIEAGQAPTAWAPLFDNKDDALAKLNYAIGTLKLKDSPDQAIPLLIKAANYNSKLNKTPILYAYLADAYERGPTAKQSAEYQAKYLAVKDTPETPESKLALENINQMIDRANDAYARAVALAGNDPVKEPWKKRLTELYTYRNKTEAGLPEMIASILSKPLPPVPTPITTLPTPAPATPVSGSATGSAPPATNAAAPTGTQPTGTQPKPSPTPVKPPATPGTSRATPNRPITRRAHVRH
jgi:hypothetical protein